MDDAIPDLSARYYIAEALVWLLNGILLVAQFAGLAPSQAIPILNRKRADNATVSVVQR